MPTIAARLDIVFRPRTFIIRHGNQSVILDPKLVKIEWDWEGERKMAYIGGSRTPPGYTTAPIFLLTPDESPETTYTVPPDLISDLELFFQMLEG